MEYVFQWTPTFFHTSTVQFFLGNRDYDLAFVIAQRAGHEVSNNPARVVTQFYHFVNVFELGNRGRIDRNLGHG